MPPRTKAKPRKAAGGPNRQPKASRTGWEAYEAYEFSPVGNSKGSVSGRVFPNGKMRALDGGIQERQSRNKNQRQKAKRPRSKVGNSKSELNRSQGSSRTGSSSGRSRGKSFYGLLAEQAKERPSLTSGSTPGQYLKMSMASMSVTSDLHEGIPVIKVSHYWGDWHRRVLTLSADQCALFITHGKIDNETHVSQLPTPFWTPSKGWKAQNKYQRYVDIADISDVQIGVVGTQVLESIKRKTREEIKGSLIVIHHHEYLGRRSLNLIVENPSHKMALVAAVATMMENYRDQQQWVGREILLLRYLWYDVDADQDTLVSEKEFLKVCERINLYKPNTKLVFRDFVQENYGKYTKGPLPSMGQQITYGECTKLISSLKGHPLAGDEIWQRLFGSAVSVTPKRFLEKFLKGCQGETKATLQDAKDLIATLNTLEMGEGSAPENPSKLEQDRFEEFLRSEWNDAYDPQSQMLPQNGLSKPLSAYWISSSHNTYLTGNQLNSRSSVEAYTTALQRGCKCLELDVWDGFERRKEATTASLEDTLVPLIYNGGTQTNPIELESVLLVVYNYLSSNRRGTPIILAIENHCSIPFQKAMAGMIKKIFGTRLFTPSSAQGKQRMPSVDDLRGCIVIQEKPPPEADNAIDLEISRKQNHRRREKEEFIDELFDKFTPGRSPEQAPFEDEPLNDSNPDLVTATEEAGMAYDREFSEITYFRGTAFKYFEDSIGMPPSYMHSINEKKITKMVTQYDNNPDLWREFNCSHLTRTYPAGYRHDSSNYNPLLAWAMGCQLVALNFQTVSTSMIMNDGRFRQHGNCGYVEKPESFMNPTVGGEDPYLAQQRRRQQVKIRILSGSCLPKPFGKRVGEHIDPLVRIELHDVKVTKRGKEQYCTEKHITKKVNLNGFSPVFDDRGHIFTVNNPDVAMLVFRLLDEDIGLQDQIASAAIPVSCLRKGYRSIQLYNEHNTRAGPFQSATLLAQIK